jgi:hypothetical protein
MNGTKYWDDKLEGKDPATDWTAAKMRHFTEEKLHFVMQQNRGGVHDTWARAEFARRENEQVNALLESVRDATVKLADSSTKLERLTIWLNWLTFVLIILTVVAVIPLVIDFWKWLHHS